MFGLIISDMYVVGDAQLHNSYTATRVMFNPDIVEVKDFIAWYGHMF